MKALLSILILSIFLGLSPITSLNKKMKDKWILTQFFEQVQDTKEFGRIIGNYPLESHAEIEIKDEQMVLNGYYEGVSPSYEIINSNKITTKGGNYIIEYFPTEDRLLVEYRRNDKIRWKYFYQRKSKQDSLFDIENLDYFIKVNCLVGSYIDLETDEKINIDLDQIGRTDYEVKTTRDHMCGDWNWLEMKKSDRIVLSSWDWRSDTLKIYELNRTRGPEGCKYYEKGDLLEELLLTTQHSSH
jgi:hypothetical protein